MAARGRELVAMLVILGLLQGAVATTYVVNAPGETGNWTFLSGTNTSYDDQFKNIKLFVGDKLSFVFDSSHDVVEVLPAQVTSCDDSNPISSHTESVEITLETAGEHGFICSISGHCSSFGMHLSVTVTESAASSPGLTPEAGGPDVGENAASLLRSGPAMVVGALLVASAVLSL